jgi:hypothetical protein
MLLLRDKVKLILDLFTFLCRLRKRELLNKVNKKPPPRKLGRGTNYEKL